MSQHCNIILLQIFILKKGKKPGWRYLTSSPISLLSRRGDTIYYSHVCFPPFTTLLYNAECVLYILKLHSMGWWLPEGREERGAGGRRGRERRRIKSFLQLKEKNF